MPFAAGADTVAAMAPHRFDLLYSTWNRRLLGVLGLGPSRAHVTVDEHWVEVRMGWGFHSRIPRTSVVGAERTYRRVWGWGVHGWRGRWLVNGSSEGLVTLTIDPAVHARTAVFALTPHEVTVSVEDPDGLVAALAVTPAVD